MENSELITKAMTYINHEFRQCEMTIEDVAAHAGFSTNYFNRIFFAHTGFNVMEYVRFTRLKRAARLLRMTDSDILNIALDCGYENHESFSRAFKKQYDLTPSEYRKKYEKVEAYYGDFFNDTIGPRLTHEFGEYKIADTDEVIDYLLEKDARRYGYTAVCFRVNGGVALYKGDDFRDGFIWFTEWDGRDTKYEGEIICDNFAKIHEYLNDFSDERFTMVVYTRKNIDDLRAELVKHGGIGSRTITTSSCVNVYCGEPYELTPPDGVVMRELTFNDFALIEEFYQKAWGISSEHPRLVYTRRELYQRDVMGNSEHSVFAFGIFNSEKLIGLSFGGLQRTRGFVVNNCVYTYLYPEYETEEMYIYAFKFVTNAALEKGALPIDDLQTPLSTDEGKCGRFDSTDLGYRTVEYVYRIE